MKEVIVIGGPNGAGKTTTATDLLPDHLHLTEFVNADEIARGLPKEPLLPRAGSCSTGFDF
jgi:predicted ABC-type ATPase